MKKRPNVVAAKAHKYEITLESNDLKYERCFYHGAGRGGGLEELAQYILLEYAHTCVCVVSLSRNSCHFSVSMSYTLCNCPKIARNQSKLQTIVKIRV